LSIIFYVKTRADSKKVTNIYQMCRFLALMAKKHILEINYEKYYIYFNKINIFHDNLLKITMYTLQIVFKRVLKFHKDISNGYRNSAKLLGYDFINLDSFIYRTNYCEAETEC